MKIAGVILLIVGILMLASGLICSFTVGTFAVPVLVSFSIVVNTVGVMLLQQHRRANR